jgi:3-oxoacyl-(acyl-carrier-protein) synthase
LFILEHWDGGDPRGARTYVEITGYGKQRDLDSMKPASGLEDSMRGALANSAISASDVDYISAYGPGHPALDATEVEVLKKVFGRHLDHIFINSIKGVTGNALSAGGPFQLVASALTIRDQLIPPTANYTTPDPLCDLDFVHSRPVKAKVDLALLNVRGLGGSASSMIVNRVVDQE